MDKLVAACLAVNQDNLALGNEVRELGMARFVRNTESPDIWDANHVDSVRANSPAEIEALLALADREYQHAGTLRFDCDARTPPEFEARLQLEGFVAVPALVSVLEGELSGRAKPFEIRPIVDEAGWDSFMVLKAQDWANTQMRLGREPEPKNGIAMAMRHRAKSPPVRFWLGYVDGTPRGFLTSWEGTDGVGQVEDLFVEEAFRHRGLATALLHHCVTDCRAHGAGPVVIVADPTDTPKRIYAAMGWRPVAVKQEYRRSRVASA